MSASATSTSSGSPSCSVSVVPSSSIPSHGTAKLTRTLSWGIVSAAVQGRSWSTSTWMPLLSRIERGASGSSSRRTWSTHGPVALTTARALTSMLTPSARVLGALGAAQRDDLGIVPRRSRPPPPLPARSRA